MTNNRSWGIQIVYFIGSLPHAIVKVAGKVLVLSIPALLGIEVWFTGPSLEMHVTRSIDPLPSPWVDIKKASCTCLVEKRERGVTRETRYITHIA